MKPIILFAVLAIATSFKNPVHSDAIIGVWENGSGKGHIQIFKQDEKYYGRIVWLRDGKDENGNPKVDRKNEDPAKRNRPLVGLVMMRDFEYEDDKWTNGHIYNPSDGKEYKAYIKSEDGKTLAVRGYIGISLLGKTDVWKRVK